MDTNAPKIEARVIYTRGDLARTILLPDGSRQFLPYRVSQDVRLSKILTTSTTLIFYLYQENAEQAIRIAATLLKAWLQGKRNHAPGYPKLDGHGRAQRITDKEFTMTWQQADNQRKTIIKAGQPYDPVAYHIPEVSTIVLPSFRDFQLLKKK